ncbi:hypothetical protein IW137_001156 [Coemansia sp. RSA 1287]|nr:hypothetical protein IW137_001156 [Coemansia sp. RSA 1287]
MGYIRSHTLDGRNYKGVGYKRRRIEQVEPAQAGSSCVVGQVGTSRAASPPLPAIYSPPPAGFESQLETWAWCWRQSHGNKDISIDIQLEIGRFVRTVEGLPRPTDQVANEAMIITNSLGASLGRARCGMDDAMNSADRAQLETAEQVFKVISKTYKSAQADYKHAYAEYRSAHTEYVLQVEAAAERVERLLYDHIESAVTARRGVNIQTSLSLLVGLPLIYVRDDAEPSIHPGTVQGFSDAHAIRDLNIGLQISHFQGQALQNFKGLQDVEIILRQAVPGVSTEHLRYLDREQDLASYFEPEILGLVQAIIHKVCPDVLVGGQVGSSGGHADYFLEVSVYVDGVSSRSAIAVIFKKPYGASKLPKPRSLVKAAETGESEFDGQMRLAGLPTRKYGRLAIGQQLREYVRVRDIASRAPADVADCLNREYGIITDYNQTWVVKFEPVSASSSAGSNDSSSNSKYLEDIDRIENLLIRVSECFFVGNSTPHMAFVYAFVVSKVAENIRASLKANPKPRRALGSVRQRSRRGRGPWN